MRRVLRGSTAAPGSAYGPIVLLQMPSDLNHSPLAETTAPIERFQAAQLDVAAQLKRLSDELRAEGKPAEAAIFDGQALLASDATLTAEVTRLIAYEACALLPAVRAAATMLAARLSTLDDAYLRERAADVRAVGEQIIAALHGSLPTVALPAGAIVVAHDLTPTHIALLRKQSVGGIATVGGGTTGHVAILARALGIPAIFGMSEDVLAIPEGTPALLRADTGRLIAAPNKADLAAYRTDQDRASAARPRRRGVRAINAQTRDGIRIELWANISHPDEARQAREQGADGIGLLRTEFLFLDRAAPPSEDEQYQAYRTALRAMQGRPVVVRTLDSGGDKPLPYLPPLHEANPFLGRRGIRLMMRFRDLFQTQLRALLRAAAEGDLRVLLPMIATPADVAWARQELAAAADTLAREGLAHRAAVPLGIMIETPAAALTLDLLARDIDFCSIGSNDLAQYLLAVDRSAAELTRQYGSDDPALWRMIGSVVREAQRLGIDISICGEIAADPQTSVRLVGLGLEKLSMTPAALAAVKATLRTVSLAEAQRVARLACADGEAAAAAFD
ncbi:MAG TPA: phosphoenolpyruvate--protein phosphotransferase [Herpetosiphonaceae bacterium]